MPIEHLSVMNLLFWHVTKTAHKLVTHLKRCQKKVIAKKFQLRGDSFYDSKKQKGSNEELILEKLNHLLVNGNSPCRQDFYFLEISVSSGQVFVHTLAGFDDELNVVAFKTK